MTRIRRVYTSKKLKSGIKMDNDILNKYYRRVARRAWLKSLFLGLIIAFVAMLVAAALVFFLDAANLYWVAIVTFAAVAGATIPLFYFFRYRPDIKEVANAVDALGLEERAVTMLELCGSNSYMARRQREDTLVASESVPATAIHIMVSTLLIVLLAVFGVLGLGATTYVGLADAGIAPGFGDVVDSVTSREEVVYYTVEYEEYDGVMWDGFIVGGGIIYGDSLQFVEEGQDCTTVYAVADEDSIFFEWTDGNQNPERTDCGIVEDMQIYAVFVEADDESSGGQGDGSEEGDASEQSDGDASEMGEEGSEQDDGSEGNSSADSSADLDADSESSDSGDSDDSDQENNKAGEGNSPDYSINNGKDDYRNEIGGAAEEAGQKVNEGSVSGDEGWVDDYFGRLNP